MTKPGQIPSGPWLFQPTKPGEVPSGPWLFEPSAAAGGTHTTSGILAGIGAVLVGIALHVGVHSTSGVLAGAGGQVTGTAARSTSAGAHGTSGVLAGAGGQVAGTALRFTAHGASGVLAGAGGQTVGTAQRSRLHGSSGLMAGDGGLLSGVAAKKVTHAALGALVGVGGQVLGVANRGLLAPAISQRSRWVVEIKQAAIPKRLVFDFISQLAGADTMTTAANTISVYSGSDPGGSLAFVGSPTFSGTQVIQFITGGVVGCIYQIISNGISQAGKQTFLNSFLVVL